VVAAARIAVTRRARRAKTARLDVHKRRTRRRRHAAGAKQVWSVVRVPSGVDADRRQRHRALLTTQRERTRVRHRRPGRLAGSGLRMALQGEGETPRAAVRPWDGTPRPTAVRARLQREWQQVQGRTEQRGSLEAARRAAGRPSAARVREQVRPWATFREIGGKSAWLCVREFFAWRDGQTPKQGGAGAGRTPTPSQRGQAARALGLTQAGKGARRTMAIAMAWGWGRWPPQRTRTPW
jgi:transposase